MTRKNRPGGSEGGTHEHLRGCDEESVRPGILRDVFVEEVDMLLCASPLSKASWGRRDSEEAGEAEGARAGKGFGKRHWGEGSDLGSYL